MPPVHDYVLDNATGANFRSDLNNALAAIVSNNSSSSEPSTKYAYQWWADTNEGVLKIRNSSNDGWVTLLQLDGTLTLEDGSASAPALGFRDDLNTGIFSSAADNLDITTGGTTRVNVSSTGINVTGTVTDDGAVHDGNVDLNGNIDVSGTSTLNNDVTFTGASANIVFDKSDNQLEFADNAKAEFGNGGDLEIFHDGSDSFIKDSSTGALKICTSLFRANNAANDEAMIKGEENGGVELYFDHSKKIETTGSGVTISGDVSIGNDSGKFLSGTGNDLQLYHDGGNSVIDNLTGGLFVKGTGSSDGIQFQNRNGNESMAKFFPDGAVELYHDNTKRLETVDVGIHVFNTVRVLGDTAPQIQFNTDTSLGTSTRAMFGMASASNNFVNGSTANDMILNCPKDFIISHGTSELMAIFKDDSSVELYCDSTKRFETTTGGAKVSGDLDIVGHAFPNANNTYDLGTSGNRWRNIYTNDLNLSNKGSTNSVDNTWGDYTIQEGESDLFLINNRNGKKYKFMLQEVS